MEFKTLSTQETQNVASDLASRILEKGSGSKAHIILFKGDLGAGKTTFIQGFARSLGAKEKVKSPTFVIMKEYSFIWPKGELGRIYHLDCYRMNDSSAISSIDLGNIFRDPSAIVLIEWPERIGDLIPRDNISVSIDHGQSIEERIINIEDNV